jgi:hypothetical protein
MDESGGPAGKPDRGAREINRYIYQIKGPYEIHINIISPAVRVRLRN